MAVEDMLFEGSEFVITHALRERMQDVNHIFC